MTQTLAQFLTEQQADPITIQHAVRYLMAELSDDLPYDDMRDEVVRAVGEEAPVEALAVLQSDSAVLLDADLAVLGVLWEDPKQRELVRGAVIDAKNKLPVVETIVIVTAAMYGLYLVTTRGRKRSFRKVVKRPEGSWEETQEIEFHNFTGPLRAMGGLLSRLMP